MTVVGVVLSRNALYLPNSSIILDFGDVIAWGVSACGVVAYGRCRLRAETALSSH